MDCVFRTSSDDGRITVVMDDSGGALVIVRNYSSWTEAQIELSAAEVLELAQWLVTQ
jgi:hypothetical protein